MRISRHQMWMNIAEVAAMRSTCFRGNTGAVIVKDRDIVSIGYNGPPAGDEHCKGNQCELDLTGGCARSIHAEINAIERARNKTSLQGCDIYVTSCPCGACASFIAGTSITHVFFRHPYRNTHGLECLIHHGITLFRITPSGMIVTTDGRILEDV